ncbi:MAG: hydantoinase/oxoprolinase family protein [Candidatus Rokubacteria bacterium]|nr:hydantoinase/oxoprolinase family protein [Candidatus Rokubacteria bacterium]
MGRYRLGIDIGGTFTDLALLDARGRVRFGKVLTTPEDPLRGLLEGLRAVLAEAGVPPRDVAHVVHGTTLITNAVIERKGARTALLTTAGFEDVLEIGREQRYDLYDLEMRMPEPLVRRRWRLGVAERTDQAGTVREPLDETSLAQAIAVMREAGIEAVAICFLHAYRNPANERRAAEGVRRVLPGVTVTSSSEVLPEMREYERASTTVLNAYVQPLTRRYMGRLKEGLARAGATRAAVHTMTSTGHLTTTDEAERVPVRLIESGPAGGCLAAVFHSRHVRVPDLVAFDMGGTTAKACLIHRGQPFMTQELEVARVHLGKKGSGLPLRVPAMDLIEIGAGGGSIAAVDALGLLRVGPRSAGAEPGPACYARGGKEPTVTDADLLLGYLAPDRFLGGAMRLDVEAARRAVQDHVADPLGLPLIEAAAGIHRIVNENMANAARVHILEKGQDPRRYPLFAFGGAGPVHAHGVARLLGTSRIIVPRGAGVTAALGFLAAPIATDQLRTYLTPLDRADWARIGTLLGEMEAEVIATLRAAGVPARQITVERAADMRYAGQGFEVTAPLPAGRLDASRAEAVARAFLRTYRERYGQAARDQPLEVVSWRVRAHSPLPPVTIEPTPRGVDPRVARTGRRPVCFDGTRFVETPVYDRAALGAGVSLRGPAILEERESTLVVPRGARLAIDRSGNVVVTLLTRRAPRRHGQLE